MKIWANTTTHNEENFIWFAVMSVIDYVDRVLIWDTGSTDKTVEIISEIKKVRGEKIEFKQAGAVDKFHFSRMRQAMLEQSKCDWVLILDGDEIWWDDSIKKLVKEIKCKGNKINGIVVPMVVPVGDIYHIQEKVAGQYRLLGERGHFSLRAINKNIPGLHVDWPYGKESYLDLNNRPIQEIEEIIFLDAPYLHVTHLRRSNSKRKTDKFKYELGDKVSRDFKFPEILSKHYPQAVVSPWSKISGFDLTLAAALTPLRKIKRRLQR